MLAAQSASFETCDPQIHCFMDCALLLWGLLWACRESAANVLDCAVPLYVNTTGCAKAMLRCHPVAPWNLCLTVLGDLYGCSPQAALHIQRLLCMYEVHNALVWAKLITSFLKIYPHLVPTYFCSVSDELGSCSNKTCLASSTCD